MAKKKRNTKGKAKGSRQSEAAKQQKSLEEQIEQLQIDNDEEESTRERSDADYDKLVAELRSKIEAIYVAENTCASCGINCKTNEDDEIELKKCDGGCDLVKYCSDECQEEHRAEHKEACEKRRVELLRDKLLFKQPESSYLGDCPLCYIPLSLDRTKSTMASCCSKLVCRGCVFAEMSRVFKDRLEPNCPFCRTSYNNQELQEEKLRKRIEANDPVAMREMGKKGYDEEDFGKAFEYMAKAAELGDAEAHYFLANLYKNGLGVEKDEEMELFHLEEASILGHPGARYNLGCKETTNGRIERAVKHWIIAGNLGDDDSMKALREFYAGGDISKEDYAATLRTHQAAVDATKSSQREFAETARKEMMGARNRVRS